VRHKPTGPVLVRTEDLSKTYKMGKQRIEALKGVSIEIHEGEFVAFTGPSGAVRLHSSSLSADSTSRAKAK